MAMTDSSYLSGKHIVVAGGGISGSAFATSLHQQWKPPDAPLPAITIYERDDVESRLNREGYSMSIRSDGERGGGVQILDDLGLYETAHEAAVLADSFSTCGRDSDDPAFIVWEPHDTDWKTVLRVDSRFIKNASKRKLGSMRIRRNALQQLLLDAVSKLPNVKLEYGKTVVGIERHKNDSTDILSILLSDGSSTTADILIDATGSSSKIRTYLRPELSPPTGLNFAKIVMISGTAKFEHHSDLPKPIRKQWGLLQSYNGIGCFLSPVDDSSALWALSYRSKHKRERLVQPISDELTTTILSEARDLGKHAGPNLRKLIDATDPSTLMVINCSDRPPFTHNLSKHGNVVHIGDANHAVSPYAGNGANMALIDGWDLAQAMIECESLELAVKQFESKMVKRCQAVLDESHSNIEFAHVTGIWAWIEWAKVHALGWVMWLMCFV